MKTTKMLLVAMLFAFGTMFVACGGDDGDDEGGVDTVQPAEDTVQPGEDTTVEPGEDTTVEPGEDTTVEPGEDTVEPGEDTVEPGEDTVEPPAGACTNDDDMVILGANDGAGQDEVKAIATDCGLGCLGDADPIVCATPCITEPTGLSDECAGCYAGTIACTITNCVAQCVADPGADACIQCQWDNGCMDEFYNCSGLDNPGPPA